ncbi:MAG: hypothetical protein ACHQQQ_12305 [Bacteroidota bacterium]
MKTTFKIFLCAAFCFTILSPKALGCACGCGVFSVGTRWMMITSPGPRLFLQYSYLNQNQNWSGLQQASADLNSDKLIMTSFYTLGTQYMVNRDWGMMFGVPLWDRYRSGLDDNGDPFTVRHSSIGDIKVMGMYTGFSEDMSTAVMFGLKLPTGPISQTLLDRDTQIGTGTTDALLSAYQMGQEDGWGWFAQGSLSYPMNERDGYKPGNDFNAALGFHYDGLNSSFFNVVPIGSVVASVRGRDSGSLADPDNTGYTRIFFSPGVELILNRALHIDFEYGIPLYSNVNGNQLVSPMLFNSTLSYQL